jgi:tape measure domain-containing protein
MSREVDQRVVELQFNNTNFEKNTKKSMDSIDRMMEKLQFKGAEKGFEKLDAAAEKVDFATMNRSLDTLQQKFSALDIMAATVLVNITNKAMNAGEKLVKSLSLDQITAGWSKYAQKTASVQTIMNATGKSITKVNQYLDKLMWYSDETSYGFTDMTASLGQLTAAGGDIDKLIPMIMGIANATAYAGKGASEFSRVIYNLNQSYSAGHLSLMDWKSVELAGVATAELKKQLIATGVELGKIKEGEVTVGSFSSSLADKWADKEVMETAFGKLAEFTQAVKKMVDANPGMQASQAIEALADQYDEVTVKAFKAAQEAKSFSEAVDATKDAVSSGWMETFDILFGNYEEAKHFWSGLAEQFWNIFAGGQDARNSWLKSAFDSGLDQLLGVEGFSDATDNFTNLLETSLKRQGLLTDEAIEDAGSFQKALEESGVTAQQLADVIWDQAEGYARMAQMSDEELNAKNLDRDKINALANAYANMADKIQNGVVDLEEFSGKMNQLSGREHFFAGILNILEGIDSVLEPVRDAFNEVFMTDGSPLYNMLKGFDDLTSSLKISDETAEKVNNVFKGLFSTIRVGLKGVSIVVKTASRVIGRLLDILSPITNLLLTIGSGIGDVLSYINYSIDYADSLSDVVLILVNAIGGLLKPIQELWSGFRVFVRGGDMETAKGQFGAFASVVDAVTVMLDKLKRGSVSASGVIGSAIQVLGSILFAAFDGIGALIGSAFGGFKKAGTTVSGFATEQVPLLERIKDAVVSLPEKAEAALIDFGGTMGGVLNMIATACKNTIALLKDFFNLQEGVDIYRLLALLDVGALSLAIYGLSKAMSIASISFKKLLENPVTSFLNSLTNAVNTWTKKNTTNNLAIIAKGLATSVGIISASIYLLSRIEDPVKATDALYKITTSLFVMIGALKLLAKTDLTGMDTAKLFGTIAAISLGISTLVTSFVKISKLPERQVDTAITALSHIAAMLIGVTGVMSMMNYRLGNLQGAGQFIAAAAAINMIALALIPLAKAAQNGLDINDACEVINGVSIALSILVVSAGWAQKLSGKVNPKPLDQVVVYLGKMAGLVIALNGIASSLLIAAGAVAAFAALGSEEMKAGMVGAVGMLAMIGIALAALSKLKTKKVLKASKAMVLASTSLVVLAGAVKLMGQAMSTDESGAGAAGVTLGLIGLVAAVSALAKNSMQTTAAAVALVAMGAALIEMAVALNMIAGANPKEIAFALGALAGSMMVLVTASILLKFASVNITGVAAACLMLATSLLILTPALKGLASIGLDGVIAGIWGMAGALIGLGVIGATPPIAIGMNTVAAAMIGLAKAFSVFAGGLIKFSIAAGILAVLAMFADPVCQAIKEAAPDIQDALIAVVNVICNTVIACAEPITLALIALLKIAITVVVETIKWAWAGEDGNGGIKGALEHLWSQITGWFDEHADIANKWINPFSLESWIDTFTNNDRPIGRIFNGIFNPILNAFGTSIDEAGDAMEKGLAANERAVKSREEKTEATKSDTAATEANTEATDRASKAYHDNAEATTKATEATAISAKAQEDQTAGLVQLTSDTGEVSYATIDCANSMLRATDKITETAEATQDSAAVAKTSAAEVDSAAKELENKPEEVKEAAANAIATGTNKANDASKTGGENNAASYIQGFTDRINTMAPGLGDDVANAINGALSGIGIDIPSFDDFKKNILNGGWTSKLIGVSNKSNITDKDREADVKKDEDDGDNKPTGTGGKGKTSSKGKGKTLAETLAEEYSKKLKANKYLQDALSKETALWELQSEHSVTNEELLAKRTEVVTKQIELQADRVAIAQQQYDTLLARVGAGNDKTKDAYNTLLDEKANLEKLRQSRHSDIWGDVLSRYENDAKTAEDEYDLWVSMYEDTATVAERSNRQMTKINKKIDAQAKVVTAAEEEYTKLKEEFGEQSQQTQVAYRKYLEEQKEQQELINELEKAQLTQFANQITRYEKEAKIVSNRQKMLEKLYDDGSLSERESAYEQAVEKYGEGSKEARRAAMQGTMSSLMGVGAAMRNMSTSLKKLTEYQKTYDFYVAQGKKDSEEALDALAELQDEQYNFVGFAESLASAFDMSENGKQAMMQLGYTISKNWKPIYNGFNQVWKKVNPAFAENLTNLIGLYSREGASETMAATMNAVVSAMRGDWGSAVASGLTAVLDIVGTDFGRTLSEAIGNALRSAFSGNGLFAQLLSKLLGGMNPGGSGGGGFFSKALDFIKRLLGRKSTGITGGGSGISKWLSAGKSALGLGKAAKAATDLVPVLSSVGTATANVASGVTTVAKAAGAAKVATTAAGAATSGTLAKVGMGVAKVAASLGPHGLLVGACVAGAALIGTAVVKNWDKVKAGIGKAWDWIKEKASGLWDGMKRIGSNLVSGLGKGVKAGAKTFGSFIISPFAGIISGVKKLFGVHSPSTVFAGIGGYLMEGLANGITNASDGVNRSLEAVADGALDIAQSSAMRLLDVLNDESDPSIQPVVDLTNAENALDWMDSRLAGDRAVTLSATRSANLAGTVNQNANRQNGKADPNDPEALSASGNRDVVDAIQSMGERIDGVARAVASMKVVMNSRKLVGEIKTDMNTALGELAERGR